MRFGPASPKKKFSGSREKDQAAPRLGEASKPGRGVSVVTRSPQTPHVRGLTRWLALAEEFGMPRMWLETVSYCLGIAGEGSFNRLSAIVFLVFLKGKCIIVMRLGGRRVVATAA